MAEFLGKAKYIVLGMIMNLCLGAVYSWSIFRKPVETGFPGTNSFESGLPYMLFLFFYAFSMPVGGKIIDRFGPRAAALIGSFVVSAGWFAAGFSQNIFHLMISYGVIGGIGVGIIYGVPMSVAGKWFPEKKGLAVGVALAGFGLSPFITAPISKMLITNYGVLSAFKILGISFFIVLSLFSLFMKYPAETVSENGTVSTLELPWQNMIKKGSFYLLWFLFLFGTFTGLMIIGISGPFGEEVIGISSYAAPFFVSLFAVFNGIGRPVYGYLTDHFGTRFSAIMIFSLNMFAALLILLAANSTKDFKIAAYAVSFSIFWSSFGGWLAVAPASTAKLFGKKNYVKNYGFVFTAYGIGAIFGGIISGEAKVVFGSYIYIFYPVVLISFIGIVLTLLFLRKPKV